MCNIERLPSRELSRSDPSEHKRLEPAFSPRRIFPTTPAGANGPSYSTVMRHRQRRSRGRRPRRPRSSCHASGCRRRRAGRCRDRHGGIHDDSWLSARANGPPTSEPSNVRSAATARPSTRSTTRSFPCVHAFASRRCGGGRIATEGGLADRDSLARVELADVMGKGDCAVGSLIVAHTPRATAATPARDRLRPPRRALPVRERPRGRSGSRRRMGP